MSTPARILYCHCTYAKIVPDDVKNAVLQQLAESGVAFDAVADLCELSARRDPGLRQLVAPEDGTVRLAACYPRAVKWLLHAAGIDWPEGRIDIGNMRTEPAEQVVQMLLNGRPESQPPAPVEEAPAPPAEVDRLSA